MATHWVCDFIPVPDVMKSFFDQLFLLNTKLAQVHLSGVSRGLACAKHWLTLWDSWQNALFGDFLLFCDGEQLMHKRSVQLENFC